ncbi:hypothetical protein HQ520_18635 [bacterium]|nr:hypothetical protein [bacterium]
MSAASESWQGLIIRKMRGAIVPRLETILTVFVASPSDLDDERNRLKEVIDRLNLTWARQLGVRLDLIRWETHTYPSIGDDPQAAINEQIPEDYDLFIGMMWYRFGTPTLRAGSGTLEEFQRAKDRFDRNPSEVHLMMYFKDAPAPVPPSRLDPKQIASMLEFRSDLEGQGVLYGSFTSLKDFENLVTLHLTRYVQAHLPKQTLASRGEGNAEPPSKSNETANVPQTEEQKEGDEPGLIDLMLQFEEEFKTAVEIIERIGTATEDVGQTMRDHTNETVGFSLGPNAANRRAAKRLIDRAAADMESYAQRMRAEVPLLKHHLNAGMHALVQAAMMTVEFAVEEDSLDQVRGSLDAVRGFQETTKTSEKQIERFRDSVASLPRMTTTLNRARHSVVSVLQQLVDELSASRAMAREAEESFSQILEQEPDQLDTPRADP